MKAVLVVLCAVLMVSGCGTIRGTTAGMLDGASKDLKSLSNVIKE
jgi:uncharacterized protein YceK